MLFNSYEFVFVFLPVTWAITALCARCGSVRAAMVTLVVASLVFYGWWNPAYLLLLAGSIGFNFVLGRLLARRAGAERGARARGPLVFGIAANLAVLAWFKYFDFLVGGAFDALDLGYHEQHILLPLAISFFTFQQITFLVEVDRGEFEEASLLRYALFVTFFPQLIAGPIVHYGEMLPQYLRRGCFEVRARNVAVGLTIFVAGLFKKVAIADHVAHYATPVFDAARDGAAIGFVEAWGGALAYTLQLYFDFSGYSDMAVGLSYLFGLRLALNFYSPYKATSIIEFWRRWHISLSRFLRDYVYIPLGGNRRGTLRRYGNVLVAMLLGGLWHGAGWTFVAWGLVHGLLLILNRLWRGLRAALGIGGLGRASLAASWAITFVAVAAAWVLFRAETFDAALAVYRGMLGMDGIVLPPSYQAHLNRLASLGDVLAASGVRFEDGLPHFGGLGEIATLAMLVAFAGLLPNVYDVMGADSPALDTTSVAPAHGEVPALLSWRPTARAAVIVVLLFVVAVFEMDGTTEFLYFRF